MDKELLEITEFVRSAKIPEHGGEMNEMLTTVIAYSFRVGEFLNFAEHSLSSHHGAAINKFESDESETETTRKAKLDAELADDRKLVQDLKNIRIHLKMLSMQLFSSIKTAREEKR